MSATRTIFFGSPPHSAEILKSLISDLKSVISVVAVVTTPDKPVDRKQVLTPSPVAQVAAENNLPVFKPTKLDDQLLKDLQEFNPDLFLVIAYGKIIPASYLETKTLNIHFSLLPKYRGALCISEPLKNGDAETGVTLMEMDAELDHGPIISRTTQEIDLEDNVDSLTVKLTQKAISLLKIDLPKYLEGDIKPKPQDHTSATFTPYTSTRTRANAFIPWTDLHPATEGSLPSRAISLHNFVRSLNPDPGAWTTIPTSKGDIDAKLLKTSIKNDQLQIDQLQLSGRNPISWKQFLSGHHLNPSQD